MISINNSKHYYCVSMCKKHGFIKCKNRIRKSESGKIYVVKTMKKISDEEKDILMEKYRKNLISNIPEA